MEDSDLGRPAKVYSLTRQGKKHWRLNSRPGAGFPPPCNYSFRTPEGLTSCDFAAFFLIVSERCFNARVEEELRCEFEIHVQQLAREFTAAGMPESEAPLAAKREFGSSAVNQEHCRDMRRRRFIDDLTRDLLFTLRTLKKSPGFTAMALLSLALSHNQYYLISLQAIDGVAMGIYGVLLTLITADLSKGSGRYNFVRGAVQSAMGLGGVLSNSLFGWMARPLGFNASFYGLTTEALGAFALYGTKRRLALIGKGRARAKSANHTRPG